MYEQDLITRLRLLYPNVRWLEPDNNIIRRLEIGYRLVILLFSLALSIPILVLVLRGELLRLSGLEFFALIIAYLWFLSLLANFWADHKELKNRIGTDGECVYFADYRGKVWSDKPEDILCDYFRLAGGHVLVLIRDKYRQSLYRNEDLEIFLFKASHMKRFTIFGYLTHLKYLRRNGYPLIAIRFAILIASVLFIVFGTITVFSEVFAIISQ